MINREYGSMQLECDTCGDTQDRFFDNDEFNRMIGDAKDDGWSIRSGRGEWVHKCPKCNSARGEFE